MALREARTTDGIRTIVAFSFIGAGLLLAAVGVVMRAGVSSQQST